MITNLASNALKFGRGSPIQISVEAQGALARVRVRDHGIGVPAEDRERIFERFERAVSDQSFSGLGLGPLDRAADRRGARRPDRGRESRRRRRRLSSSSCRAIAVAKLRILVVDDDPASVEALCELLETAGHDVDYAENGRQALELLRDGERFCVILLDIMMPVMNGYEFREEQLKDPNLASIPVIRRHRGCARPRNGRQQIASRRASSRNPSRRASCFARSDGTAFPKTPPESVGPHGPGNGTLAAHSTAPGARETEMDDGRGHTLRPGRRQVSDRTPPNPGPRETTERRSCPGGKGARRSRRSDWANASTPWSISPVPVATDTGARRRGRARRAG